MKTKLIAVLALCLALLALCAAAGAEEVALTAGSRTFTCSADAAELDLGDFTIPDTEEDYAALDAFLHSLPSLTKFDMFSTDISVDHALALGEEFPQVKFGWTILIPCRNTLRTDRPPHRLRTDDTAFSTQHNLSSSSHDEHVWEVLKYCPNLLALDIGHNNSIKDYSFLNYVPNLRVLIVSFNRNQRGEEGPPMDLTPIGNMKDLEYLEICKSNVADISPLANCTRLVDLNICTNHIQDLTPLRGLKNLRRLFLFSCHNYSSKPIPKEEVRELKEYIPDCDINNVTLNCGGKWRQHHRYKTLASMFSYQMLDKPQAYEPFENLD